MISVIVPLYNKVQTIEKTLSSVWKQTYTDYEIVIVDDGSTDGSADVVKSFNDTRIRLFVQPNAGVSAARNHGVSEARGEYVAFLDADDEWREDYLSTQIRLAEKYPQCAVFATSYEARTSEGVLSPAVIRKLPFSGVDGVLDNYFQVASCSQPPLFTSAVMARRQAVLDVGGFPLGIKSGEDLLTWARLAVKYRIAFCKQPKVVFTIEGYEVTSKPKRSNDENDYVGHELLRLRDEYNPPFISQYVSLWYKMRSSVFMRQTRRLLSIREALRGLRCYPGNYKLYAYILLNLLPSRLQPFEK